MSNALKPGMCNMPINMTIAERTVWGRLAFNDSRSTGDYLKQLLLKALREANAEAAKQIESIRAERLRLKHGVTLLAVFTLSLWLQFSGGQSEVRRTKTNRCAHAKVTKSKRGEELSYEWSEV